MRTRRWRRMMSWAPLTHQTPQSPSGWPFPLICTPPGDVCPATVRYGVRTRIALFKVIVPLTRNTHVRGPEASIALRRLPGPESSRFVTSITLPPRPPTALAPNPSAVGKAFTVLFVAADAGGVVEPRRLDNSALTTSTASCHSAGRRNDCEPATG